MSVKRSFVDDDDHDNERNNDGVALLMLKFK